MSYKEKFSELRNKLERWKSHNEVHARPADEALYQFLSNLLKLGEDDPKEDEAPIVEAPVVATSESDPPGEGGNNPGGTPDLP